MSVATAAKIQLLSEAKDFKATVWAELGDTCKHKTFGNRVLVAIFFRSHKTAGGIIRPQTNVEEDAYQSKVGLVVQKGPFAFVGDDNADFADNVEIGDFILYRASDGFPLSRNGVPCRVLKDEQIMLKIDDPQEWF